VRASREELGGRRTSLGSRDERRCHSHEVLDGVAAERAPGVQSYHSAQDLGALVRDYTKWDDQPYSLGAFAESAVRAYKIAMTPPMGPVLIVANNEIQAHAMEGQRPRIPNAY